MAAPFGVLCAPLQSSYRPAAAAGEESAVTAIENRAPRARAARQAGEAQGPRGERRAEARPFPGA